MAASPAPPPRKRRKKPPETFKELYNRVLNERVTYGIRGKPQTTSVLQTLIYFCSEQANAGDTKAQTTFEYIKKVGGYYDAPPEKARTGVFVFYAPMGKEEWLAEARRTKLSINPLEGIPGAEELILDRKRRRDEDDPTGN